MKLGPANSPGCPTEASGTKLKPGNVEAAAVEATTARMEAQDGRFVALKEVLVQHPNTEHRIEEGDGEEKREGALGREMQIDREIDIDR